MAFTASTVWEVQTGGDDTNNGGGFDTGVAGFPTDGAATSATSAAPVFTSASYNFVAGDVGAWIYIKSGTNWTPGWYIIVSVSSNAATLNATIGTAVLSAGTPSTVTGCATTASPTGATWGIDYSQQAAAEISFTDILVGATTTQFTSAAHPVGKNFIGNIISVVSGATVQRVAVVSTSGTTATCDKSLGTAAQVGVGSLGGALASPGTLATLMIAINRAFIKTGAYSISSASTNISGGCYSVTAIVSVSGYATVRGDFGTAPVFTATGSISTFTVFASTGNDCEYANLSVDCSSYTSGRGFSLARAQAYKLKASNCTNGGISNASGMCIQCSATGCSTVAAIATAKCFGCEAYANTVTGFDTGSIFINCLSYNNTGATTDGFAPNSVAIVYANCVAYGNGRDGFRGSAGNGGWTTVAVNCIAEANTGIGFNRNTNANFSLLSCATFSNTGGPTSTGSETIVVNLIAGASSFFVNAASGNFSLNNTTGAGAACRAAGVLGAYPSGTTTGRQDIGAAQSRVPWQTLNLTGGING